MTTSPGGVPRLVLRALRAEDVDRLETLPDRRVQLRQWLARQERGEMYVAVAELDGVPIGRRCLDFTLTADERIGFAFGAGVHE